MCRCSPYSEERKQHVPTTSGTASPDCTSQVCLRRVDSVRCEGRCVLVSVANFERTHLCNNQASTNWLLTGALNVHNSNSLVALVARPLELAFVGCRVKGRHSKAEDVGKPPATRQEMPSTNMSNLCYRQSLSPATYIPACLVLHITCRWHEGVRERAGLNKQV